ncbi:class I SAM-dependent methyltransferase [Agromyces kandeliae]|uniref:Methyltransferase domain-containing protein n=1 Tax=Agromyces kandeliae TaxID=2666141 RepID=A0A6L5R5U4_9MICO|nr:class I SAM-dependent methyltransferase [Agromyces kandeliae]MRX45461.1 methyltransferase domain-containing protein [Agromyces kandeliae]
MAGEVDGASGVRGGLLADPSDPDPRRVARSSDAVASVYGPTRPGYPLEAVEWLVGGAASVLDLGAGTGGLTEALVALDREVVAVDPVAEMLEELEIRVPGVRRILGTAEDLPVEDDSVDAVVAGGAWHWFQRERAVPEIARVLRRGGVLGLAWNRRDTSPDWLRAAGEIMHEPLDAAPSSSAPSVRVGGPFGPVESHRVEWVQRMSRARFLDRVRSRGGRSTAPPDEQRTVLAAVETLLVTHPDVAGDDELAVPYVTYCFRAVRG